MCIRDRLSATQHSINQSKNTKEANLFLVTCDSSRKFQNGPVPPHWTIDLHSCHQIPTGFELLLEKFFFLNSLLWLKTLVNTPFLGCFPGVSQEHYFSLFLCSKSPRLLLKKFFFLSKPAPFMQNISKCTFLGCFPGVSRVFPGCVRAFFFAHSCFC